MTSRALTVGALALFTLAGSDPARAQMYGLGGNISPVLSRLDPITGTVLESHLVSGHQALFGGLAADASGALYSIDGYNDEFFDRTFRIDRSTGAGTVIGPTGFNWNFRTIHAHPGTGVLYAATDNRLYTINTTTGAATLVANITAPGLGQLTAMAINRAGEAFVTDIAGVNLYSLNLATGQATLLGNLGGATNWYNDLAFSDTDVLYGARTNGGVYTISTSPVQETFAFNGNYTGLTFVIQGNTCYPNCDNSTTAPVLNVQDFTCFLQRYAAGESYANCDNSTVSPVLNVQDFTCFLQSYAAGCP
jgi:hypothetical protein